MTSIEFKPGWNLISICGDPINSFKELIDTTGELKNIFIYENNKYSSVDLNSIPTSDKSYWIYVTDTFRIDETVVTAIYPSFTFLLTNKWQLFNNSLSTSINLETYIDQNLLNSIKMVKRNDNTNKYEPFDLTQLIECGTVYWIRADILNPVEITFKPANELEIENFSNTFIQQVQTVADGNHINIEDTNLEPLPQAYVDFSKNLYNLIKTDLTDLGLTDEDEIVNLIVNGDENSDGLRQLIKVEFLYKTTLNTNINISELIGRNDTITQIIIREEEKLEEIVNQLLDDIYNNVFSEDMKTKFYKGNGEITINEVSNNILVTRTNGLSEIINDNLRWLNIRDQRKTELLSLVSLPRSGGGPLEEYNITVTAATITSDEITVKIDESKQVQIIDEISSYVELAVGRSTDGGETTGQAETNWLWPYNRITETYDGTDDSDKFPPTNDQNLTPTRWKIIDNKELIAYLGQQELSDDTLNNNLWNIELTDNFYTVFQKGLDDNLISKSVSNNLEIYTPVDRNANPYITCIMEDTADDDSIQNKQRHIFQISTFKKLAGENVLQNGVSSELTYKRKPLPPRPSPPELEYLTPWNDTFEYKMISNYDRITPGFDQFGYDDLKFLLGLNENFEANITDSHIIIDICDVTISCDETIQDNIYGNFYKYQVTVPYRISDSAPKYNFNAGFTLANNNNSANYITHIDKWGRMPLDINGIQFRAFKEPLFDSQTNDGIAIIPNAGEPTILKNTSLRECFSRGGPDDLLEPTLYQTPTNYGGLINWNTSNVVDMRYMFYNNNNFSEEITNWCDISLDYENIHPIIDYDLEWKPIYCDAISLHPANDMFKNADAWNVRFIRDGLISPDPESVNYCDRYYFGPPNEWIKRTV